MQLVTLQDAVQQLKQAHQQRPLAEDDFTFDSGSGQLILKDSKPDDVQTVSPADVTVHKAESPPPPVFAPTPAATYGNLAPLQIAMASSSHANSPGFSRMIHEAALGRHLETVVLAKTGNSSLGFSVVGLKSEHQGELGIFVQKIQPGGLAER